MTKRPYRAFGFVAFENTYTGGEPLVDNYEEGRQWWNLFTKGGFYNNVSLDNDNPIDDFPTGTVLTPTELATFHGNVSHEVNEDTVIWCIPADFNNNYMPVCEKWFLGAGESATLPRFTKLLFVDGSLSVGDNTLTDVTQLHLKNSEATVTANEDCWGILFL